MTEQMPDQSSEMPPSRDKRAAGQTSDGDISFRLPRRTHVPGDVAAVAPSRTPRTTRQKIAALAASTCVAGLGLVAILPLATQLDRSEETAAASVQVQQQELFSETSMVDLPDSFLEIAAEATAEVVEASYTFNPKVLVNYPFARPVMLTDVFGYRTAPVAQFHDAQDFAASEGTPVQVIADGIVLEAGFAPDGCGFGLKVEHQIDGNEVTSRYCHMVDGSHTHQVGDEVKMGDPAGQVGQTGMSFGAHLHLALRVNDEPAEPMAFLAKYNTTLREAPGTKDGKATPLADITAKATAADTSGTL